MGYTDLLGKLLFIIFLTGLFTPDGERVQVRRVDLLVEVPHNAEWKSSGQVFAKIEKGLMTYSDVGGVAAAGAGGAAAVGVAAAGAGGAAAGGVAAAGAGGAAAGGVAAAGGAAAEGAAAGAGGVEPDEENINKKHRSRIEGAWTRRGFGVKFLREQVHSIARGRRKQKGGKSGSGVLW